MNRFFMYMGAKTKELPLIKALVPQFRGQVIEPFAGSGTVALDLERPCVLNDFNSDVMNLYKVVGDATLYPQLQTRLNYWKGLTAHDDLEKEYYRMRDYLNNKSNIDTLGRAEAYLVTRQLCHRGMQRENSKGEFNVPFGHDRKFNTALNDQHHFFLKNETQLMCGDFEQCINKATADDWIFVDSPYFERQDYTGKGFSEGDHRRLAQSLAQTSAKWLLIHPDCDLYRELYSGYIIEEEDFRYNIHFGKKGADRTSAKVKHLYIRNYAL